jgi:hypothetical protein
MGFVAEVVERWISAAGVRRDLFHAFDVVAVHPCLPGVLGIQTTSKANLATRVEKVRRQPEVSTWLKAGNRAECWGWFKENGKWAVERIEIKAGDLEPVLLTPRRRSRRQRRGERQGDLFASEER